MKKLLILAVAAAVAMTSCSKKDDASLSKVSYTLYHSQIENIQGENVSNLNWDSDNEFVATISNGTIKGQYVGKTVVRESSHGLSFNVEVKPQYNLYSEPDMDWGASISTIRSRYGTPYSSDSESLIYKSSNKNAPYYIYLFKNGVMYCSGVAVPLSAGYSLVDFLSERYLAYSVDMNSYTASFAHCYGKLSAPSVDYAVAFQYSSSIGGFVVSYTSNSYTISIAPEPNDGTRSNVDIPTNIEEVFIKNQIALE